VLEKLRQFHNGNLPKTFGYGTLGRKYKGILSHKDEFIGNILVIGRKFD
jgi:hypothetical protein